MIRTKPKPVASPHSPFLQRQRSYCGWTKTSTHLRNHVMMIPLQIPASMMVSTMASFRGAIFGSRNHPPYTPSA